MKKFYTLLGGIALAVAVMTPGISAQSMPGYSMLKYTISPADGSDVNELETIIIDFPDPVDGIDAPYPYDEYRQLCHAYMRIYGY